VFNGKDDEPLGVRLKQRFHEIIERSHGFLLKKEKDEMGVSLFLITHETNARRVNPCVSAVLFGEADIEVVLQ